MSHRGLPATRKLVNNHPRLNTLSNEAIHLLSMSPSDVKTSRWHFYKDGLYEEAGEAYLTIELLNSYEWARKRLKKGLQLDGYIRGSVIGWLETLSSLRLPRSLISTNDSSSWEIYFLALVTRDIYPHKVPSACFCLLWCAVHADRQSVHSNRDPTLGITAARSKLNLFHPY
jgi:hypothetical protein